MVHPDSEKSNWYEDQGPYNGKHWREDEEEGVEEHFSGCVVCCG